MKTICFKPMLVGVIMMACCASQVGLKFVYGPIDTSLVGAWAGSVQDDDEVREWIQTRRKNGTVTTEFTYRSGGEETGRFVDNGRWWAKDGVFYETFADSRDNPDVYEYSFVRNDTVFFNKIRDSIDGETFEPYSFTETKLNESE